jgi:hypothetical protein
MLDIDGVKPGSQVLALHTMLAGLDEAGKEAAWREIESELRKFESASGFEGPCELIVIAGSA